MTKNVSWLLLALATAGGCADAARAQDVVSWQTFSQVELVKQKDRYVPKFAAGIAALDQKDVKVQGFMMPLETGDKQTHFVLSATPQTCAFCMPGGPESMVEVKAKTPVKYTFDAGGGERQALDPERRPDRHFLPDRRRRTPSK